MTTGEQAYNNWREVMNRRGGKRGNNPEPRWKDLKPWIKKVWQESVGDTVTGR